MLEFTLNGRRVSTDLDGDTPLLWILRDDLGMTGTKFGCGMGLCGACTVHVNGQAIRSCSMPVKAVAGSEVTTIEGLSGDGSHPLQQAWINNNVSQCGYCQPGQIMQAAAFLAKNAAPSDGEIRQAMSGNICRCGTYGRIHAAIKDAAADLRGEKATMDDGNAKALATEWFCQNAPRS